MRDWQPVWDAPRYEALLAGLSTLQGLVPLCDEALSLERLCLETLSVVTRETLAENATYTRSRPETSCECILNPDR